MEQILQSKKCLQKADIEVDLSPIHGYGVFARAPIAHKEVIEECPVLVFYRLQLEYRDILSSRLFAWNGDDVALALGFGSMYNHSDTPNALYSVDKQKQVLRFIALQPIEIGEEILIDYGEHWFSVRKQKALRYEEREDAWGVFMVVAFLFVLLVMSRIFPVNFQEFVSNNQTNAQVVSTKG